MSPNNATSCVYILLVAAMIPGRVQAQSAVQRVNVSVSPIVVMAVFGELSPLLIHGGRNQPIRVVENATSFYNLTTNVQNVEITAVLDSPMPVGTSLRLSGESTLGLPSGPVDVSDATSHIVVVSGIRRGLENGRTLTYYFSADENVESLPLQFRSVTLTLVDPSTGLSSSMIQSVSFGVTPGVPTTTTR